MRIVVWSAAVAALAVWSLLAWGGHWLLDWSSDWAAANADKLLSGPEIVEWSSWLMLGIGNASEILVLILWALGAIVIIGVAGLVHRVLAGRARKPACQRRLESRPLWRSKSGPLKVA